MEQNTTYMYSTHLRHHNNQEAWRYVDGEDVAGCPILAWTIGWGAHCQCGP